MTPVNSRTVNVQVFNVVSTTLSLRLRLYGQNGWTAPTTTMIYAGNSFTATLVMTRPVLSAAVRVWQDAPAREVMEQYSLGGNPGNMYSEGGNMYSEGGNMYSEGGNMYSEGGNMYSEGGDIRSLMGNMYSEGAPVLSSDGQVLLYTRHITVPEGTLYTLQAASRIPDPPPWVTGVGKGYWLSGSAGADLTGASISLGYAGNEVPSGEEPFLQVYVLTGKTWTALPTILDQDNNLAVAPVGGPGL